MNSLFAKISSRENISNSLFAKISSRENKVLYSRSRRLSSKLYYTLPVVIIMLILVKHVPDVIYNINAMLIKLISCADISKYEHLCFLRKFQITPLGVTLV